MKKDPSFVVMGQLGGSYGLKGWNHILSYAQPIENILNYPTWYVEQQGEWKAFKLVEGRPHGKGIVAHLQGVDTPEAASLMTQSLIAIPKEALPPAKEDEFYWADLEGLTVQTPEGKILGQIKYLYENAGAHIMVIQKAEEKEHQIPFVLHDTVLSVNLDEKIVVVDWVIAG